MSNCGVGEGTTQIEEVKYEESEMYYKKRI